MSISSSARMSAAYELASSEVDIVKIVWCTRMCMLSENQEYWNVEMAFSLTGLNVWARARLDLFLPFQKVPKDGLSLLRSDCPSVRASATIKFPAMIGL